MGHRSKREHHVRESLVGGPACFSRNCPRPGWLRAWVEEREVGDEAAGESRDQTTLALVAKVREAEDQEGCRRDSSEGRFNRPGPRREKARVLVYSGHQNKNGCTLVA